MSALAKLDERVAALEAASEQLADQTREAHGATKELRRLKAEIEQLLSTDVRRLVDEAVSTHVQAGLESYKTALSESIDKVDAKISKRFTHLTNLYLTGQSNGRGVPLSELAERAKRGTW